MSTKNEAPDLMSPREAAWQAVTASLRASGLKPKPLLLEKFARAKALEYANNNNLQLKGREADQIGRGIADSIVKNWRPPSERRRPKKSRADRLQTERQIVQRYYEALESGQTLTRRSLAAEFNISFNAVQRILKANNLTPNSLQKSLSRESQILIDVVSEYVPVDGRRIFDKNEILSVLDIEVEKGGDLFDEINNARCGYLFTECDSSWPFPLKRIVVCRGRRTHYIMRDGKRVLQSPKDWFEHAERLRLNPGRHPLPPSQRYYCIGVLPRPRGATERDLLSVIRVAQGSRSLTDWRRFVEASVSLTDAGVITVNGGDRDAIVTVVQGALKLHLDDLEKAIGLAASWVIDADVKAAARDVLGLAVELMQLSGYRGVYRDWLGAWCEKCGYERRIESGDLPGRDLNRLAHILNALDIIDGVDGVDFEGFNDLFFLGEADYKKSDRHHDLSPHTSEIEDLLWDVPPEERGYIFPPDDHE